MQYVKVMRVYIIPAENKTEAKAKLEFYGDAEFLDWESWKEVPGSKSLLQQLKAQVLG